ncbi:MAG TPA: hypothetical protein VG144_05005 [Gaiellaceae bacterium]|nr:hypothetical protein [Gaiellaceae bacterium]
MRRVAVVLIGAVLLGWAAGASAEGSGRPTLKLTRTEPISVQGLRFLARERVHVKVTVGEERTAKRVVANRRGTFTLSFPSLDYDRCTSLFARAVGSGGSRAVLKLPQPQCPPRG